MARRAARKDQDAPVREGDILGISDANPEVTIPRPARPGTGHPAGIEVHKPATGLEDVPRGSGATGIDMGSGGEGTDVSPRPSRPHSIDEGEEE